MTSQSSEPKNSKANVLKLIKKFAYLEGEFITRAGNVTNYYIDKYLFETRPEILDPLGDVLAKMMPPASAYDRIAAPELGAVPIAAVLSVKVNKPFVIVKKQAKDYGTQNLIEGDFNEGENVVVVEDILTTGGAAIRACEICHRAGLSVVDVIGVINREEGAYENLRKLGFSCKALFSKTELLAC